MGTHTVYIIWSNPIFRDALRMLLTHPDVEWVGSSAEINLAVDEILSLQPDTVLVEVTEQADLDTFMHLLEKGIYRLQIVSMNIDTNEVTVYHREYRSVVHQEELLQLILTPFLPGGIHED